MRTVHGWFRATTGGLPSTFWYLWAGTLINRLGGFVLIFLAIYLTERRGFSSFEAGLTIGAWGVGGAVGTMASGVLADRWGRRPTLLTANLGAASLMLALGFAHELPAVLAAALLLGLFAEAARPAFGAMIVDVVPERDRLRAFSLNYWALNLGFACAAILAGFAAGADYLLLFVVNAGTTLIAGAVIFCKVPETRTVTVARPTITAPQHRPGGLHTVLRDRVFLLFVLLNLVNALIFLQHISMLPIAMSDDGLSPTSYGWVIALNGILIVAGQLFVPRLIRDRSRSHVLALASMVAGIGFGLTAFADAAWFYAVTVLIWTAGEMLSSPPNSSLIAELSPIDLRGRYQAVFSLSWQIAGASAPILGGLVREQLGDPVLWLGCATLGLLTAGAYLASSPARERRAAALRPVVAPAVTPVESTTTTTVDAVPAAAAGPASVAATPVAPASAGQAPHDGPVPPATKPVGLAKK